MSKTSSVPRNRMSRFARLGGMAGGIAGGMIAEGLRQLSRGNLPSPADLVLTASGTATLQALLYKRPMVVGYKLNPLTYKLLTFFRRIRIPYVAMANLLADEELASEYIQDECTPEALALGMENLLTDPPRVALITRRYHEIHKQLQRDAARRSAYAVMKLIAGK